MFYACRYSVVKYRRSEAYPVPSWILISCVWLLHINVYDIMILKSAKYSEMTLVPLCKNMEKRVVDKIFMLRKLKKYLTYKTNL